MNRHPYPTALSDHEGTILKLHLPSPQVGGRPRHHSGRDILKALFDILRSGCAWRLMPQDFPPWKTVYPYCRLWRGPGLWARRHQALPAPRRVQSGRNAQPSAAILESPSVKTTMVGGPRGYAGGKKIKGCKRHVLVATQGLILRVLVHPAAISDRDGAKLLLAPLADQTPRRHIWADSG
jgi:putative transposase